MYREQCPKCAKSGKDRSRDNLAVYEDPNEDGHSHCFSCGYHVHPTTLRMLRNKLNGIPPICNSNSLSDSAWGATRNIPARPLSWLKGYGITDEEIQEHGIWYDTDKDLLVFPVYNGEVLVCTNSRYFGPSTKHPKYVTKGRKDHFKFFKAPRDTDVLVLVEDYVSAIKVSRHFNCIPLLGSHIPHELVLSLLPTRPTVRVWLDPDKLHSAISQAARVRQWISSTATIISSKDPKDYTDAQIKYLVRESLSSSASSISQLRNVGAVQ